MHQQIRSAVQRLNLPRHFYKAAERISDETQAYLDTPMLPAEAFVKTVNGIFEGMMK